MKQQLNNYLKKLTKKDLVELGKIYRVKGFCRKKSRKKTFRNTKNNLVNILIRTKKISFDDMKEFLNEKGCNVIDNSLKLENSKIEINIENFNYNFTDREKTSDKSESVYSSFENINEPLSIGLVSNTNNQLDSIIPIDDEEKKSDHQVFYKNKTNEEPSYQNNFISKFIEHLFILENKYKNIDSLDITHQIYHRILENKLLNNSILDFDLLDDDYKYFVNSCEIKHSLGIDGFKLENLENNLYTLKLYQYYDNENKMYDYSEYSRFLCLYDLFVFNFNNTRGNKSVSNNIYFEGKEIYLYEKPIVLLNPSSQISDEEFPRKDEMEICFLDNIDEDIIIKLDKFQNDIVDEIFDILSNKDECWIESPTGTGKSYMITKFINRLDKKEIKNIVFTTPLQELVKEAYDWFRERCPNYSVKCVYQGHEFEDDYDIYICCSQSLKKIKDYMYVDYLIVDESHVQQKHSDNLFINKKLFFSASQKICSVKNCQHIYCCKDDIDIKRGLLECIENKFISEPRFNFEIYEENVTMKNKIDVVYDRYKKGEKILVNFKNQRNAKMFYKLFQQEYNCKDCYIWISENRFNDYQNFINFKKSSNSILCNVRKLEMGVNVHDITTIIFVDMWNSKTRMRQMIGRGTRLHPRKRNMFDVVIFQSLNDNEDITLTKLISILLEDIYQYKEQRKNTKRSNEQDVEEDDFELLRKMFNLDDNILSKIQTKVYTIYKEFLEDEKRLSFEYKKEKEFIKQYFMQKGKFRTRMNYKKFFYIYEFDKLEGMSYKPELKYKKINFCWDNYLSRDIVNYPKNLHKLIDKINELMENYNRRRRRRRSSGFKLDVNNLKEYEIIIQNDSSHKLPLNWINYYNVDC